jgi:hypothetical protein
MRLANHFAQRGFTVLTSSLSTGGDFLEAIPAERFDYIITNPPYSLKPQFIKRCQQFKVPYTLLIPVETTGNVRVLDLYPEGNYEELALKGRIHFEMPNLGDPMVFKPGDEMYAWQWGDPVSKTEIVDGKKKTYSWIKHQAQFPVKWLGEGILGRPRYIAEVAYTCDLYLKPTQNIRPMTFRKPLHQLPLEMGS